MKLILVVIAVLLLPAALVAGDYKGLFGTSKSRVIEPVSVVFQPLDADRKTPLDEVHVSCYRKGASNACSELKTSSPGKVTVMLTVPRLVTRSHLFELSSEPLVTLETELDMVFIHVDYEQKHQRYDIAELLGMQSGPTRIELVPKSRD